MALMPGARLGSYEILSPLGAGGMGEVYRARDAELNRDVAIKILLSDVAHDPERLLRFRREAQVLAALDHPSIAHVYGLEDSNGVRAIVMELIEGPTLADRIAQGPIPLDEALSIAKQIAEALEAAHDHGIVHRDLKPANIKLRPDGLVKVLDFGLAKASSAGAAGGHVLAHSPTVTSPAMMTGVGMILGTAGYMSPEQAKGRAIDKRSDVWAFGCVLYEMLTGTRAFPGDDVSDTLAAVLKGEPDWDALPSDVPPAVRALLQGCLRKDRKARIGDISTALFVLGQPHQAAQSGLVAPLPIWRRAMPVVLSAILAGALVGTAWYVSRSPLTQLTVTRFTLPAGQSPQEPVTFSMIALSPDGAQMVYAANNRLYRRSMSELDVHAIQGTDGYQFVTDPVFSPDGQSIAFYARGDRTLKKIAVTGRGALTICPADFLYGISWERDSIVFGQAGKGIMRVSQNGGTPELLVAVKDGEIAYGPQMLPDGEHVLFTLATGSALDRWDSAHIVVQSLTSGKRTTLIEGGSDGRYIPTGHLVYGVGGSVFAAAFDVRRLEILGGPMPVVEGVRRSAGGTTGATHFSFSNSGSLMYIAGPITTPWLMGDVEIAFTDRLGVVERLNLPPGRYSSPRVSPDGTRIAFGADEGKEAIIYTFDLSGAGAIRRLTFGGNNRFPIWTSDGRRIAFQSDRDGDLAIFWQLADGTGPAERLTKPEQGESHEPESWSPTSDSFLFSITTRSDVSLWTLSLPDRKATSFGDVHSTYSIGAAFSPDGRSVAYTTRELGSPGTTMYVQPFPATGAKYQLFVKGANSTPHKAVWSRDGKELFYVPRIGELEAVGVSTQPTFAFGNAVSLPRPFQPGPPNSRTLYDVAPSGKFLGLVPAAQSETERLAPQIHVVLNWFEELRDRVPPK